MAEPIRLGLLIEDPEDVREFEDNMRKPKVTKQAVPKAQKMKIFSFDSQFKGLIELLFHENFSFETT